jgi:hypothetical protein
MSFSVPKTIGEYLKHFANELGARGRAIPTAAQARRCAIATIAKVEAPAVSGPAISCDGDFEEMAGEPGCRCNRGVRHRQNSDCTRKCLRRSRGRSFTAIAMVPPQLVMKWARECFLRWQSTRHSFGCRIAMSVPMFLPPSKKCHPSVDAVLKQRTTENEKCSLAKSKKWSGT